MWLVRTQQRGCVDDEKAGVGGIYLSVIRTLQCTSSCNDGLRLTLD